VLDQLLEEIGEGRIAVPPDVVDIPQAGVADLVRSAHPAEDARRIWPSAGRIHRNGLLARPGRQLIASAAISAGRSSLTTTASGLSVTLPDWVMIRAAAGRPARPPDES
jgi:hypothetical protein